MLDHWMWPAQHSDDLPRRCILRALIAYIYCSNEWMVKDYTYEHPTYGEWDTYVYNEHAMYKFHTIVSLAVGIGCSVVRIKE